MKYPTEIEARTTVRGPLLRKGSLSASTALSVNMTSYVGRIVEICAYTAPIYACFTPLTNTALDYDDTDDVFVDGAVFRIEPGECKYHVVQADKPWLRLRSVSSTLGDVRAQLISERT